MGPVLQLQRIRRGPASAGECAALSARAFRVTDAELWIVEPTTEGVLRGIFQPTSVNALARTSGGAEVRVGPGTLLALLTLPSPAAVIGATPSTILNRGVRPLLRAITKTGVVANYFGRDWISGAGRPIAFVGFAHDSTTGRTLVEAVIAISSPVATRSRVSYRDKEPATLTEIAGRPIVIDALADAIARGFVADASDALPVGEAANDDAIAPRPLAWSATTEAPIGEIGVGIDAHGRVRIGGELMASVDAIARVEVRLAAIDRKNEVAVREVLVSELDRPEVALFGVSSAESFVPLVVSTGADPSATKLR
jgi:hypothetical protein